MPEAFPNTYQTEQQPAGGSAILLDMGVVKSPYGILKIVEMALDLLGFICIMSSGVFSYLSRGTWFNTVAMGGFWYCAILLVLYVFHIPEKIPKIPLKKVELILAALWTFFYLIAASLAANFGQIEAYAAAAFFGFAAMVAYGYDTWECFSQVGGGKVIIGTTTNNTRQSPQSPTTY